MLTFNGSLKVYVALKPCDMRKSFDGSGYWVVAKRLEKGTFSWPQDIQGGREKITINPTALAMLTDGVDLRDGMKRPWYEPR
jgi:transposase